MRNSTRTIFTAFSFAGAILLIFGVMLTALSRFGYTSASTAGLFALLAGSAISLISLFAANFRLSSLEKEMDTAVDVVHRMSLGELYENENDQRELLAALSDVSSYLREKSAFADKIAAGDLSDSSVITSDRDVLGRSFHSMAVKLRKLVQTQDDRDRLQVATEKLLNEVSEVAAGDLTVKAEVSAGLTGEIAEAFNLMTVNLRSLIRQVKDITVQVGSSANTISETTEQLAHGSVAQASLVNRTTAAITDMAARIQEVSANAAMSANVASDSLVAARSGTKAANDNIAAIGSVRRQVQETAKRIKRLGERSQEIGQIVAMIEDLSDRTSLLALNASLQAASAGESGSGFAVVAEEVERLAERSNRLTNQITSLTQTINFETKEVVASMEETIREVVSGSASADKAGQALVEIENITTELAELLRSISESTRIQARSSEDISGAMSQISDVTELVSNSSKRAAESVRILVRLSEDLRGSVSPFKLPAEVGKNRQSGGDRVFVN